MPGQHQKLYGTQHWRRLAKAQLRREPTCRFCAAQGLVVPAKVADHIVKHNGDPQAFFCGELQSLCWDCHEQRKKSIESIGYDKTIGRDGWPVDRTHPAYRESVLPAKPEPPPKPKFPWESL
jgi:5-methylcytosine-specific restriction enzyme A